MKFLLKHRVAFFLFAVLFAVLQVAMHGTSHIVPAFAVVGVASVLLATPQLSNNLCVTLTVPELLMDVIEAFAVRIPGLAGMGTDFRPGSLKLDQTYTAHIPTVPTTETIVNANYGNMTGQNARDCLIDVPVTVDKHIGTKLKWQHLNAIKDQKNKYEEVIQLAGYSMAKTVVDDIISKFTPNNITQQSVFSVATSDADMLDSICGRMNMVGAIDTNRCMLVNTPVANVLAGDSRLTSADYAGQRVRGKGYRRWTDVNGFAQIDEYPTLANSTSGTALTSVTGEADDDLLTTTGQAPATGQGFTITFASGFTGLTSGTTYYSIRISATTFKAATTYENAMAGTAINITADGTGATVTPTQTLTGFAWDPRAYAILGGIPEDFNQGFLDSIGCPKVMGFETVTHPDLGISMAAVSWQQAGTGDINLALTMVYGVSVGRQSATNAPGDKTDYAGHRLVSA